VITVSNAQCKHVSKHVGKNAVVSIVGNVNKWNKKKTITISNLVPS